MKKFITFSLILSFIFTSCSNDDSNSETTEEGQTPVVLPAREVGSTFCGPFEISEPVILSRMDNITISGLEITTATASGHCIQISDCNNIIIENCKLGSVIGSGIHILKSTNVTVRNCSISNVQRGVYALESSGISVTNNDVINVIGPANPGGQMAQFDKVTGTGNEVNFNVAENFLGESDTEDIINMFKTTGTVDDPVQIKGNWIRGGGPSDSGGGILVGDGGGSYFVVEDNILVDPGQYGIAVPGGTNVQVLRNKIYGKQQSFTNVGIFVADRFQGRFECNNITLGGNEVNWTNRDGVLNHDYINETCSDVKGIDDNIWGADIDETILPEQITLECISFE